MKNVYLLISLLILILIGWVVSKFKESKIDFESKEEKQKTVDENKYVEPVHKQLGREQKTKISKPNNAYKEWTSEEDAELKNLILQGVTISDLAEKFGRNHGAIRSRIKKIELSKNKAQSDTFQPNYNFYFYHFTDPRNIPSIKKNGLLSWKELLDKNIVHYPASDKLSRDLDKKHNLEDYVRLSLGKNHPMFSAAIYYGRVKELVWLKINPNVIDLPDTKFSDDNATSNRAKIDGNKNTALKSSSQQSEILIKKKIEPRFINFPN